MTAAPGVPQRAPERRILHIDMDAFYASVEQRDDPRLRGRPVVVGGSPDSRAVVCTCSYEARRFGVRSAMPCSKARRLCPDAIFVPPDFGRYKAVSVELRRIFKSATELVEPLSLDEAYLDVTENRLGMALGRDVAIHLKARIRDELHLTASAGVGPNKLIAKIASDVRKPDGLCVVAPSRVLDFLAPLPVGRLYGVGPRTAERLGELGMKTVMDLRGAEAHGLERVLGSFGRFLHALAFGHDDRPVVPYHIPKSRGAETTLSVDLTDLRAIARLVEEQAEEVADGLRQLGRPARTVTLKVRYSDFTTISRSRTLPAPTRDAAVLCEVALSLLHTQTEAGRRPIRLVGVQGHNLLDPFAPEQLSLPLEFKSVMG